MYVFIMYGTFYNLQGASIHDFKNIGHINVKGTPWDETFSMLSILKI